MNSFYINLDGLSIERGGESNRGRRRVQHSILKGSCHYKWNLPLRMAVNPNKIEVVEDRIVEILKTKSPSERLRIGFELWEFAHRAITQSLKAQHSDWDEKKIQKETARRISHGAI